MFYNRASTNTPKPKSLAERKPTPYIKIKMHDNSQSPPPSKRAKIAIDEEDISNSTATEKSK